MTTGVLKLGIPAEAAATHLALLGWYPVRWRRYGGRRFVGIRNEVQYAWVQGGHVCFDPIDYAADERSCEWWELTDATVLLLAGTIDNTLLGW